jgi:hypothetical protein
MPDINMPISEPVEEDIIYPISEADIGAFLNKTELHNHLLAKMSESKFNLSMLENSLEQAKKQVKRIELNCAVIQGRLEILEEILSEDFEEEIENDESEDDNTTE